ncbi:hypothetical protein JHK82_033001 [Glycine max]|nr:hypothetical protein JHK82_033001 [Glycine max]
MKNGQTWARKCKSKTGYRWEGIMNVLKNQKVTGGISPRGAVLACKNKCMAYWHGDFSIGCHNSTPHLPFWLWSSEGNALDTTITILGGSAPSKRIVAVSILNTQSTNLPSQNPNNRVFPFKGAMPLVDTSIGTCPTH